MAQVVNYFENNVVFEEGPFILCYSAGYFRIEVETKGHKCPTLLDSSIYALLKKELGYSGGFTIRAVREPEVDWLNRQVGLGRIVCENGCWVTK